MMVRTTKTIVSSPNLHAPLPHKTFTVWKQNKSHSSQHFKRCIKPVSGNRTGPKNALEPLPITSLEITALTGL